MSQQSLRMSGPRTTNGPGNTFPTSRTSADMATFAQASARNRTRPSSDLYGHLPGRAGEAAPGQGEADSQDKIAQQWIADIDQYEITLEEMAAATLDQDFKDELSAIEQWFRVLSEAERTAALYALLQQTTQVQNRFFVQVLQQMGKSHPLSTVLSPANMEKDALSNRLSDAMNKLNPDMNRTSTPRPITSSATGNRTSGLDASTIKALFPDAAAAIETEIAKFTQHTGNPPTSSRNSGLYPRQSFGSGAIRAVPEESVGVNAAGTTQENTTGQGMGGGIMADVRPKSCQASSSHLSQGLSTATSALMSPNAHQAAAENHMLGSASLAGETTAMDVPLLSPYPTSANWASMMNTPLTANFNTQPSVNQADMVANAAAMKLAALSTVNNRFALDDVRKYRRARSNDPSMAGSSGRQLSSTPGQLGAIYMPDTSQTYTAEQVMSLQPHGIGLVSHRTRPNSPSVAFTNLGTAGHPPQLPFSTPHAPGFLSAYDSTNAMIHGLANMQLGVGIPHDSYLTDTGELVRGRSPRGRRGSSKPPEHPTDPGLLQDIPAWLRSLRLHKYTDNLKDLKWNELIELNDQQLEERGVNALGARRKLLKVFEQVKEAKAGGKLA